MLLAWRPPVGISSYRGDGSIARLKHAINPGFKIDFEEFSLAAPYSKVYRLDGLPRPRHHGQYQVGLVVALDAEEDLSWPSLPRWLRADSIGTLTLRVRTRANDVRLEAHGQVGGQSWSRFVDDGIFALLRSPPGSAHVISRLASDLGDDADARPMTLEVAYTPGPDAVPRLARIRIMAGGRV